MSDGVSLRELGRRLGVSEGAVRKARDSGRIKAAILPNGRVDPDLATALWQQNTDPSLQRDVQAPRPPSAGDAPGVQPPAEPRAKGADITVARTKLVFENALIAEVKRKRAQASVIDREKTKALFQTLARSFRDGLFGFPDKHHAQMAAELGCDPHRLYEVLSAHLRQYCEKSIARIGEETKL